MSTIESHLESSDVAAVEQLGEAYKRLSDELSKVIVGQGSVIEMLSVALFARGHSLVMGVPGLAKTLLVSRIAEVLDLSFSRIQFTPDLMPMDITGTDILQQVDARREFEFSRGPIFANIVLADEINRAPAKTQAALLEAMQEHRVTVAGRTYQLDAPFFVLATQNPIEQEGTYPLPEAQLDRFMFLIDVDYPSRDEELLIARRTTGEAHKELDRVLTMDEVLTFQKLVRKVPVPDHVYEFAVDFVRATRPNDPSSPSWLKPLVAFGAGPRAIQNLVLGAKSRAALLGSYICSMEDVLAVASCTLSHRVVTTFNAESDGLTSGDIVKRLIEHLQK